MKRIFLLLVAVISFCFGMPQTEASGGAIAVVFVDRDGWPLFLDDNDFVRTEAIAAFKKHVPQGYNIHCSYDTDYAARLYLDNEKEGMYFSRAAGYDFFIKIRIVGVDTPEAIHFRHPRASFDIYESGAELQSTMYSFHATTQYVYNMGSSVTGNVGESAESVQRRGLQRAFDENAEHWGEKIRTILSEEAPQENETSTDYFHELARGKTR